MNNLWREQIQKSRDEHEDEYIINLVKLAGYESLDDVFNKGVPITELESFSDEASLMTWGDSKPNRYWRWPCREVISNRIIEKFGSTKAYQNSPQFIKRKTEKIENTNFERYGWKNPGQSEEHKMLMRKGPKCKNPFSSKEFRYSEYIKGKSPLPDDIADFKEYRKKVDKLTAEVRESVEWTGKCYYTGIDIYRYDGGKFINRNDYNLATIDHKISVLGGYLRGISPEIIASKDNLCWCSKHFNSLKGYKCEDECRLSGMIERYKEVWELMKNED